MMWHEAFGHGIKESMITRDENGNITKINQPSGIQEQKHSYTHKVVTCMPGKASSTPNAHDARFDRDFRFFTRF